MSKEILLKPFEVWEYYAENHERLSEIMKLIAMNEETGISIYVTGCDEPSMLPRCMIVVELDDEPVENGKFVAYEDECEECVDAVYAEYLPDSFTPTIGTPSEEEYTPDEATVCQAVIDEREEELDVAIMRFLSTALEMPYLSITDISNETLEEIKDHFLAYLSQEQGFEVYRPMYLEFDNGDGNLTVRFEEYPYEYLEEPEDAGKPIPL